VTAGSTTTAPATTSNDAMPASTCTAPNATSAVVRAAPEGTASCQCSAVFCRPIPATTNTDQAHRTSNAPPRIHPMGGVS
jgi:hypothetical protein